MNQTSLEVFSVCGRVSGLRPQYHIFGKGDRPDIPVET